MLLERLRSRFGGGCGPFPPYLVDAAQRLFEELADPSHERTLIHGDYHPENILSSRRDSWLAIDPKGVVGDPAYDVATFAGSPVPDADATGARRPLGKCVDQLAEELGMEPEVIAGWGVVQSALSGWWSYEDHGHGWEEAFTRAQRFVSMRGTR
jgi:streptomycin 6-kinase